MELDSLSDPDLVPQAVAAAVGVKEQPGRTLAATLAEALRDRELLLILDNCEHLVAACAALAATLTRACPRLHLLVTSREVLGVAGETTWQVPPLSLPDPRRLPPIDQFSMYEAVRLFIDRATAARPDFRVTNENAAAVAEICHRLDGIPLAIELAAARIRVLSAEDIAHRLIDRFRLLRSGNRAALPRQQTLQAAVDWSHDQLAPAEQALFRRLSVFAGGFTLQAAEAVCSGDPVEDWDVLDLLGQLVNKSLVHAGQQQGETRYRLLETLRLYGGEKLAAAGEETAVRRRHLDHFLGLAEQAHPELRGPAGPAWLQRLTAEHDNLRAALDWARSQPDPDPALRLGIALGLYWYLRSHLQEGRERLAGLLSLARDSEHKSRRAHLLYAAGRLASLQGDRTAAPAHYEQSLALFRELGDTRNVAGRLNNLGLALAEKGQHDQSMDHFREALEVARSGGHLADELMALVYLGRGFLFKRQFEAAREMLAGVVSRARLHLSDQQLRRHAQISLAIAMTHLGDFPGARPLLEEVVAETRADADLATLAYALINLGFLEDRAGDSRRALALQLESLRIFQSTEATRHVPYALAELVALLVGAGEYDRATRLYGAALRMLGVDDISRVMSFMQQRYSVAADAARTALGEAAYSAALTAGQQMSLPEIFALALAGSEAVGA